MSSSKSTSKSSSLAPAVSRAVNILDLLADSPGVPFTLTDIAREIGAAKSSTSNICKILEEANLIQFFHGGYIIGRRTAELGGVYLSSFDQVWDFYRVCSQSPVLSTELVHLAVRNGKNAVILARYGGASTLRFNREVGASFPAAVSGLGRALLMPLRNTDITDLHHDEPEFPVLTGQTIRNIDELLPRMDQARTRGYAVDQGGIYPSIYTIAVPILPVVNETDLENVFSIAVSVICSTIPPELPEEQIDRLVSALHEAAKKLNNPMALSSRMQRNKINN